MEQGCGSWCSVWGKRSGDLSQGATGGDGFVSQLCTLLNVEATGMGIAPVLVKASLNPKANYDMLVFRSQDQRALKLRQTMIRIAKSSPTLIRRRSLDDSLLRICLILRTEMFGGIG